MADFCPFTGLPEHIMQGATAAARTGDIFAEVPESDDKREFNRGFAFACAQMLRCYSAEEVIGAACLTLEEVENLGLEDYDLEPFRKFFRRRRVGSPCEGRTQRWTDRRRGVTMDTKDKLENVNEYVQQILPKGSAGAFMRLFTIPYVLAGFAYMLALAEMPGRLFADSVIFMVAFVVFSTIWFMFNKAGVYTADTINAVVESSPKYAEIQGKLTAAESEISRLQAVKIDSLPEYQELSRKYQETLGAGNYYRGELERLTGQKFPEPT